jgi:hypothetical protein
VRGGKQNFMNLMALSVLKKGGGGYEDEYLAGRDAV